MPAIAASPPSTPSSALGARAGKPRAAERLNADRRADNVSVDIDVAGHDALDEARDRFVDAGVQAEGETVTGGVDLVDQFVERVALVAQHMQHRPEHLALDVRDLVHFDQRRRYECPARGALT